MTTEISVPSYMVAEMKSLAIRCSDESARNLRTVAKLWPRVGGSQQTNIVNDARNGVSEKLEAESKSYGRKSVKFASEAMAPVDTERLKELAAIWPSLRPTKQADLVAYTQTVCGL